MDYILENKSYYKHCKCNKYESINNINLPFYFSQNCNANVINIIVHFD